MTTKELRPYAREYNSRIHVGKPARPKVLAPCPGCGELLGTRERREHKAMHRKLSSAYGEPGQAKL